MKVVFKLTLLVALISCSYCVGQNTDKTFLANYIDSIRVEYNLKENPMILIDGVAISYDNMKDGWFSILKEEVHSIEFIKKGDSKVYGSKDAYGVVLLTTRKSILKILDQSFIHKIKRIYVVDDKVVNKYFVDSLDRKKIQEVKIINEQSKISKYTSEDFDQLVMISTKKKKH